MRPAVLIYNPKSGRRRTQGILPTILARIERAGFHVEPLATAGPGDATRLAREAAARPGVEVAFAMGGDGTLREAAAGLLGSEVALGLLPAGTANVMSLALGLPRRALAAASALPGLEPQAIDVGMVGDEPFLMCATAGLDAAVMARQDGKLKKFLGPGAMVWPALHQWWKYDYPHIELRFAGRSVRVSHFAVCNIPYYGGSFQMAPGADLRDGLLDLVFFRGSGRRATLGMARDLALGRHVKRRDVEVHKVEEVELVGPADVQLQIDGDVPAVAPPVRIGLARQRLWVLAPTPCA